MPSIRLAKPNAYTLRQESSRLELAFMTGQISTTELDKYMKTRLELAQSSKLERLLDPRD